MGFFENTLTNIDGEIANFVHAVFLQLSPLVHTLWRLMMITFVALYGYFVMVSGNFDAREMFEKIFKMVLVGAIATEWGNFTLVVYDMAVNFPSEIADVIMSTKGETGNGVNSALNDYFDQSSVAYGELLKKASLRSPVFFLYAAFVAIATFILGSYALYLLVLAKLGVAILLVVGPIFILLLIFKDTKELFMGWLRTLLGFALIPLFVYTLMALILSLLIGSIDTIETALEHPDLQGLASSVTAFTVTALMSVALCTQIMGITNGITGGWSLSTRGHAGGYANRIRANAAGKTMDKAGSAGRRGVASSGNAIRRGSASVSSAIRNRF